MVKIIGVGDNVVDRYIDLGKMFPGGNALNVAVLAHRYGVASAYIGRIGNDIAGRHIYETLKEEKVDISRIQVQEGPNAYAAVTLVNGDRTFVGGDKGVSTAIQLSKEDYEYIKTFDLVHSSIYSSIESILPILKESSKLVSFDYSDCYDDTYLKKTLRYVDYAFFSGSGKSLEEIKKLQKRIAAQGPQMVLVTRGADGAILYFQENYYEQSIVSTSVVDTLGAGDGFIARFLVGVLQDESLRESLQYAAEAAGKVCGYYGAFGYGTCIE